MNMFFVIGGTVVTPELDGAILPGITRDSVIKVLKEFGMPVEERAVSIGEIVSAYKSGKLDEAFGTGTAAVISPVGVIKYGDTVMEIGGGKIGEKSLWLYDRITGIQNRKYPDPFGWVKELN
jgi:branched-chain amino acid aminotransferase